MILIDVLIDTFIENETSVPPQHKGLSWHRFKVVGSVEEARHHFDSLQLLGLSEGQIRIRAISFNGDTADIDFRGR